MPRYVAPLRAVADVKNAPLRAKMEALGFTDVTGFGISKTSFATSPKPS